MGTMLTLLPFWRTKRRLRLAMKQKLNRLLELCWVCQVHMRTCHQACSVPVQVVQFQASVEQSTLFLHVSFFFCYNALHVPV